MANTPTLSKLKIKVNGVDTVYYLKDQDVRDDLAAFEEEITEALEEKVDKSQLDTSSGHIVNSIPLYNSNGKLASNAVTSSDSTDTLTNKGYVDTAITSAIAEIDTFEAKIVDSLPAIPIDPTEAAEFYEENKHILYLKKRIIRTKLVGYKYEFNYVSQDTPSLPLAADTLTFNFTYTDLEHSTSPISCSALSLGTTQFSVRPTGTSGESNIIIAGGVIWNSKHFTFESESEIPTSQYSDINDWFLLNADKQTVYDNQYDEYILTRIQQGSTTPAVYEYRFEYIGHTEIDLSNYYTKPEVNNLVNAKRDLITSMPTGVAVYTAERSSLTGPIEQTYITASSSKGSNSIVMRDNAGRFQAEDPANNADVATKKYVDDHIGDGVVNDVTYTNSTHTLNKSTKEGQSTVHVFGDFADADSANVSATSTSQFATAGVTLAMDSTDTEMLVVTEVTPTTVSVTGTATPVQKS